MNNVNAETGIRFGTIYGHEAPDLMEAIFEHGTDDSYTAFKNDLIDRVVGVLENAESADETADGIASAIDSSRDEDVNSIAAEAYEAIEDLDFEENTEVVLRASVREIATNAVERMLDRDVIQYQNDEASHSYTDSEGNLFSMSYLGGAPLIWCIQTNKIVHVRSLCSMCVPNAGDLNSGMVGAAEGFECYGVPDFYIPKAVLPHS
jgi:hypothetical protein